MKQAIPANNAGFVPRPHIVLLGAGASVAAAPNGDKNGKRIPVLNSLPATLGIEAELKQAGFKLPISDFEQAFTEICADEGKAELRKLVEDRVYSYFSTLQLPDEPTVYDYLVTGLRHKDVIATFNWDPFLIQAYIRNNAFETGPRFLFLHGSVAVGLCMAHKTMGFPWQVCSKCGGQFEKSQLLYPVGKKDYAKDKFIASQWEQLKRDLAIGYGFTIFGYSGPKTDMEARQLMSEQWTASPIYQQSEVEIIDIADRDWLEENWQDVICSHHYRIHSDWKQALFYQHPRRTTEALYDSLVMCAPRWEQPFPASSELSSLKHHVAGLMSEEVLGKREIGS